jgi:hypothetical protein
MLAMIADPVLGRNHFKMYSQRFLEAEKKGSKEEDREEEVEEEEEEVEEEVVEEEVVEVEVVVVVVLGLLAIARWGLARSTRWSKNSEPVRRSDRSVPNGCHLRVP